MKENLRIIKEMEQEFIILVTEIDMKEISKMI